MPKPKTTPEPPAEIKPARGPTNVFGGVPLAMLAARIPAVMVARIKARARQRKVPIAVIIAERDWT